MSSKPTIVFVPGAWSGHDVFDEVRSVLASRGWQSETATNRTVGANPPTMHLQDDAAAIRAILQRLADEGKKIILAVHSYGGLVGAEAAQGFGIKQRAEQGLPGGVILFTYIASFVTPKGMSLKKMLGGQLPPWMHLENDSVTPMMPEKILFNDLEPKEANRWIAKLQPQCENSFTDEVSYEPWHDIPCAYVHAENDTALPLEIQEAMVKQLGPGTLTYRTSAGHFPFLTQPTTVVDDLEAAAEQISQKI
ncbi:alpha/beta-hydrolase [Aaosphaeria arxii CBS 175.79]|uniref:Alpha/beta-hydrolase n=1 Tax=Aaosphaeria arxii CBS 175.79 TaxID=1450172 RepID=A0A6A5X7P1_9PLEO|nr:alpha/beta-hydrolase [Aaosphaeria arxii CBS 175.79]KAF2008952.1 alpha/beta-hydrolase [Aaosphaeria arxii CBS 175.79]